jgi:transposase
MQKVITHVGLDVHAERIVIASLQGQSKVPLVSDIPNDAKVIRRTFQRLAKETYDLRCCYEAGPCGFELHRQLTKMGIACEVIAPGLIPVRAGDRVKTDRRDATKLARLFRAGELTNITVPSADQEAVRDLVRLRDNIRKDLTSARSRLQHFLLRHGRVFRSGRGWTQRYWVWLRAQQFDRECERLTFEHYVHEVEHQQARRADVDAEIERVARTDPYAAPVAKLVCLRGFSTLGAMALLAEIGDFRRFQNPRELMSFVGLVPREYSSGASVRRGGITKTGNSLVRRILIEAAWHYRHRPLFGPHATRLLQGQPPELIEYVRKAQTRLFRRYTRLVSRGKKSQVAATAVARELCGFTWGLMTATA